ncbi:hypothetical protein LS70_009710 [Helicobacter sp. MIT 11-5569]|uniref:hypothetical protein n=1 Tax=Helicobacter sp. MIT 11-5569 TaxID=1548151 RepID=UPI00051FE81B|nr:hypothetical protein [Helicobacter sp. MIT 11-5569]TLD79717.1 hypothetical protein LS70_009710 [Helicobacter sp. MIT 11-5569]
MSAINKETKENLKAFSQDDFKNAKTNTTQNTNKTFENYPLDNYGFMGSEFLKEAGLSENLRFHSNSLQAIKNYLTLPFYEHNSEDGNAYFSNYFNSVDLGGGLKNAFEELENFIQIKDSYTKAELLEAFKNDKDFMDIKLRSDIPLILDYTTTENGSEKIALEGVILLFSLSNYGEAYAKSDKSELGEYGKYLAGFPNSWLDSPMIAKDSTFEETRKIVTKSMTDWFLQKVLKLDKTIDYETQNPAKSEIQALKYLGMESQKESTKKYKNI